MPGSRVLYSQDRSQQRASAAVDARSDKLAETRRPGS